VFECARQPLSHTATLLLQEPLAGRRPPRTMMRTLFLLSLPAVARAHSAMTIPEPRNAVDADEKPWGGPVPHPLPFEPWCPYPSKAAASTDDRNISGANGQACFWFSNGCAIGCEECDGSTRGPIPSFNCSLDECTPTGRKISFGPKAPICSAGDSMNATMCDPMQRTVNTAAECGGPDDYFFYSPWRAPGYAPVRPALTMNAAPQHLPLLLVSTRGYLVFDSRCPLHGPVALHAR
jgi:hypothetical protein